MLPILQTKYLFKIIVWPKNLSLVDLMFVFALYLLLGKLRNERLCF